MIIHAFGVLCSPLELGNVLKKLKISHAMVDNSLTAHTKVRHLTPAQPAWPIILPSVKACSRFRSKYTRQILFICDSFAQLKTANVKILDPVDMMRSVQKALEYATANPIEWKLALAEPTLDEYVQHATKPSFLNDVQTEIYRITPYDLRKAVQAEVIAYLGGLLGYRKLMARLNSSHKLTRIKALVVAPKCAVLKDAITAYRHGQDLKEVAEAYKVETFEIMYIFKSSTQTKP